jgi:uncharacterized membrane-anchored protein
MPTAPLIQRDETPTATPLRLTKVPQVTAFFWITKVVTTGMGESTSDFLALRLGPIPAVALAGVVLAVVLTLQLRARRYLPWLYWTAVVMVSVFGTMAADVLHVGLGVPYVASTAFYAVALAAIFWVWYATEGTLSIHGIRTRRREVFYWATVLATFALGTAAGDLTATTLHLGYLPSGLMFAVLIAVPALSFRFARLNAVLAFWFAYVVTRPLGASFADWSAVSPAHHGLGLGTGPVSLAALAVIVVLVAYLSRRESVSH